MIIHKKCDIFESGADIICHQVNCQGVMGSGVAKQVRSKYPKAYIEYSKWCQTMSPHELLGKAQLVFLRYPWEDNPNNEPMGIINIFGQLNYGYNGACYTDYDALKNAFKTIADFVHIDNTHPVLAFPYKFGCARGGGDWNIVYQIIKEAFQDCMVFICEYDGG